jgi:hypothetical protein
MTDDKLQADIERAHRVRHILESDDFKDAVKRVQERIWDEFCATSPDEVGQLQIHRLKQWALGEVVRQLQGDVDAGKVAADRLEWFRRHFRRDAA